MFKYFPKDTLTKWFVGAVAMAVAVSVAYVLIVPSDMPEPDLPAPTAMLEEPADLDLPQDESAPDLQIAIMAPATETPPSFDLVRISDLGDVLIAGKAPARSAVSVLIDEHTVAQTTSTAAGEFVLMFEVPPSREARVLELEVHLTTGERLRSVDTLMLAPRSDNVAAQADDTGAQASQAVHNVESVPLIQEPDTAQPAPVASAPGSDLGVASLDLASETGADAHASQQTEPPSQPEQQAADPGAPVAVMLRADGGVQVLDDRGGEQDAGGNLSIDSVTYDTGGQVALSGRTQQGAAEIQIYLDNQPIQRARATPDGNWQAHLDGIERGVYQLRVDELDDAAQVTSRAEIPFERVTPEIAREASGPQALIVQPGNTLWAMSREQFGDGRRYMLIFDANRDQIRNPDLIYPGQVFVVPQTAE